MVIFAVNDCLEGLHSVFDLNKLAGDASEDFSNMERLRQEALDFARTGHGQFVVFRQFVHAQNGDDILKRLILLQRFLNAASGVIMFLADNRWRQHAADRVKRVNGRINAKLGNRTVQRGRCVQVGK